MTDYVTDDLSKRRSYDVADEQKYINIKGHFTRPDLELGRPKTMIIGPLIVLPIYFKYILR